jgi:hypothetical protein
MYFQWLALYLVVCPLLIAVISSGTAGGGCHSLPACPGAAIPAQSRLAVSSLVLLPTLDLVISLALGAVTRTEGWRRS